MTIRTTASLWVNGQGFSYATDLDPIEIDSLNELHDVATEYAVNAAEETPLADNEDLRIDFYVTGSDEPSASLWVKECAA